jgi:hypothetical protein
MIDKSKLRGADIITSVLFFALGIYILIEAFQMPLKDSYAGVNSVWYVSPALFPLIIGAAMILLAIAIFSFAMKNGGMAALKSSVAALKGTRLLSDANIRYAAVLVALLSMVYVNLKMVDFYLTIVLYLVFTITVFYLDDVRIMRSVFYLYFIEMSILLILRVTGLAVVLDKLFYYFVDSIALVMIIVLLVRMVALIRKSEQAPVYRKKFRQAMLMSWITPFFVVIIFRYMLRVPLPKEGAVVNVMSMIYYLFR